MRRIAAVLAIVVGVGLVGFTIVEHVFSRSEDAQTIADHYRGLMSADGLRDLSRGFAAVQAAGGELGTKALPRLQQSLGMDDAQFAAYVSRVMPNIAQFDAQAPGIVKLVGPVIAQMRAERSDYARADQIPTGFLPLSSAPWLFVGIGILLIAVGAFARLRPGTLASAALALVGLGIFLVPLVLGIPGKVDAAVRVTAIGRVGLAPATAQKAVGATRLFDGMVDDVRTRLEPALAPILEPQSGAGEGHQEFARAFPTLATFADDWVRTTSAKSHALSDGQVALGATFANADRIPLEPIPWMFIVPGFVIAALAGATLLPSRRPARVAAPRVTPGTAAV
jgi:hypothetical protein